MNDDIFESNSFTSSDITSLLASDAIAIVSFLST